MMATALPPKAKSPAACPVCGKAALVDFRPFCSRRCADVDLHRWLSEAYVVPVAEDDEESTRDRRPPGEGDA